MDCLHHPAVAVLDAKHANGQRRHHLFNVKLLVTVQQVVNDADGGLLVGADLYAHREAHAGDGSTGLAMPSSVSRLTNIALMRTNAGLRSRSLSSRPTSHS